MIQHPLRVALLMVFVFATAGCGLFEPVPGDENKRQGGRPPQTGTNIPRKMSDSVKPAKSEKKTKAPKAKPSPKPKRERPKPAGKVDDDFVTRGGFR